MWMLVFKNVVLTEAYLKWIMLIAGDVMTAAGVACFFRTYMPLQVHELFVAELSDRYSLKINRVKLVFDLSFLVLSVVPQQVLYCGLIRYCPFFFPLH